MSPGEQDLRRAAQMIEAARRQAVPKLSQDAAARRAGISGGRWRDIVHGRKMLGGGQVIPVVGPPDTLVRMARAVGMENQVRQLLGLPLVEQPPRKPSRRAEELITQVEALLEQLRAELGPPPPPRNDLSDGSDMRETG